ncbi:hypothetical protein [Streptomyces sp. NPDC088915]|uniref:hypothetical protein n=1 Tax=Streptomyces sp. NPDC088915 TaxID=3365912 RepID=UPI00381E3FEE
MPPSFTAWSNGRLARLKAARAVGDDTMAAKLGDELREAYLRLGNRSTGTPEEQNGYLLARYTRTPVPELCAVGIDTNAWPMPVRQESSGTLVSEAEASPETSKRITDLFTAAGPLRARFARETRSHYSVEHRPEDQQVHQGTPLPWAIVDTATGVAIAYHPDQELAEYQADRASAAYETWRGQP